MKTSLGPRDLLTSTKGPYCESWESTTNVLEQFGNNALSSKFITASPPPKKVCTSDENRLPNSPPQFGNRGLQKMKDEEASKITTPSPIMRRRMVNPTRSPSSNSLLQARTSIGRTNSMQTIHVRFNVPMAKGSSTASTPKTARKLDMAPLPAAPAKHVLLNKKTTMTVMHEDKVVLSRMSKDCVTESVVRSRCTKEWHTESVSNFRCPEEKTEVPVPVTAPVPPAPVYLEEPTTPSTKRKWSVKKRRNSVATTPKKEVRKNVVHTDAILRNRGESDKVLSETAKNDLRHGRFMELFVSEQRCAERVIALVPVRKALLEAKAITEEDADTLFMNAGKLGQLMQESHAIYVDLAKTYDSWNTMIAPTLRARLMVSLPEYEKYLMGYDASLKLFESFKENKKAVHVLEKCGVSMHDLHSWLAEAMQRLYKYLVALQSIVQETPENHSDRQDLVDVLGMVRRFMDGVNERKRDGEMQAKLQRITALFYPQDCENLLEELSEVCSKQTFIQGGPITLLEVEELHYQRPHACTADLLHSLDGLISGPQQSNSIEAGTHQGASKYLNLACPILDPKKVPFHGCDESAQQGKDELKKLRGSMSMDTLEDASSEYYAILTDGHLLLVFQDEKHLCLDTVMPLDMLWILDDQDRPNELIVVFPGGMRRIGAAPVGSSVSWGTTNSVGEWKAAISKEIEARMEKCPLRKKQRCSSSVWLEEDGTIVVKMNVKGNAQPDKESEQTVKYDSAFQMAQNSKNVKAPKKMANFLGRLKTPKKRE